MSKNIVICCDGTSNEYGTDITNVIRIYQTLLRDSATQVAYYQPGVGTMGERDWIPYLGRFIRWFKNMIGGAFGYGILSNIANCYHYLSENYEPGDKVFVFGFSRGAYTARALCGFIQMFGLFDRGNYISVDYAIELFKKKKSAAVFEIAQGFKSTFGRPCQIHFVGVWDTVSSVGVVWNPLAFPFTHRTKIISIARHALAIDEKRKNFRQNMWAADGGPSDLKQVWFPGVHADVGGGYTEETSGLAKVSLTWMLREAELAGLVVDAAMKNHVLGQTGSLTKADPNATAHESLAGKWWIAEFIPKKMWNYKKGKESWDWSLNQKRKIPPGSMIHACVLQRQKGLGYKPSNLPANLPVEN